MSCDSPFNVGYDDVAPISAGFCWIYLNGTSSSAHPMQNPLNTLLIGGKSNDAEWLNAI